MTTKLSSKGQIVLPAAARRRLGLRAGTVFNCTVRDGEIVLAPVGTKAAEPRFVRCKKTGLVSLATDKDAAPLTTERVAALLADFP
jgi:AbrB family looped-hinge helix DNA binding protein